MQRTLALVSPLTLSLVLTLASGCGGGQEGPAAAAPGADMPARYWSDAPLPGAIDVKVARAERKDGDEVVLRGTLQDFGELATFRLVEDSLADCVEKGDGCETPWDYCCEDAGELASLTVNVEFLEGDLPGQWSLRGAHGLDRLTEVEVAGTLHFDPAGNMRLAATRLARQAR